MVKNHGNNSPGFIFVIFRLKHIMGLRFFIAALLVPVVLAGGLPAPASGLTPPVERDICRINAIVHELREAEHPMPWQSEERPTVTEISVEIRRAELLEKRTQDDSSRCIMYDYGHLEWFKLCDEAELKPGMRISASEGTTIGAGRYCLFDVEVLGE